MKIDNRSSKPILKRHKIGILTKQENQQLNRTDKVLVFAVPRYSFFYCQFTFPTHIIRNSNQNLQTSEAFITFFNTFAIINLYSL